MRVALVLWSGGVGGAERATATLAGELLERGHDAAVVFVTHPGELAAELRRRSVPYSSLGLGRGRDVLLHPRRLAALVGRAGADAAVTVSAGYLPAALRAGGYRGVAIAVNHGRILNRDALGRAARLVRQADRAAGHRATDAEVAVSDFLAERLRRERFRAPRIERIYNGIRLEDYEHPRRADSGQSPVQIVWAGRMIQGKGVEDVIRALALLPSDPPARLVLAGDGPLRPELERVASEAGVEGRVEFAGVTSDMPGLLAGSDVAVAASTTFVESFGFFALEAMASGLPVVVTRNGGLAEVVDDGQTGRVVEPGDVGGLSAALRFYTENEEIRRVDGDRGRTRCAEVFSVDRTAQGYLALIEKIAR